MLQGELPDKFHLVTRPFEKAMTDLIDFGSKDKNGNRYGVTYLCDLTRYIDMEPIPDKSAPTVAKALCKLIFRYGVPDQLLCDNGKEFKGITEKMIKDMCGIYISHISPLNPRSNRIERYHRELKLQFQLLGVELDDWSDSYGLVLFNVNTKQTPTLQGLSPYSALFLRHPRDPLSIPILTKSSKKWLDLFPEFKLFANLAQGHKKRWEATKRNSYTKLQPGQNVMIYQRPPVGSCKKLFVWWQGPFKVIRRTSPSVYLLECQKSSKRLIRNIRLLRPITLKTRERHRSTPESPPIATEEEEETQDSTAPPLNSVDSMPNLNELISKTSKTESLKETELDKTTVTLREKPNRRARPTRLPSKYDDYVVS